MFLRGLYYYFFLEFQLCEARPDLSGALFARRHDEQKSGNGGRKCAPKKKKVRFFLRQNDKITFRAMTKKNCPKSGTVFGINYL